MAYRNVHLTFADEHEHAANPGRKPHQGRDWIGAREAERILGVSRAACLRLVRVGQLPAKLIDEPGKGRRRYLIKLADVLQLRDQGTALRCRPRRSRIRVLWLRLFGPIPDGFTVRPRDGNLANTQPDNLALVPLNRKLRALSMRQRRKSARIVHWTREMRMTLRRDFATRATEDLAREFGCSVIAVRAQAGRMKIRKSIGYISQRMRAARALPLGTERRCTSYKMKGIVMVKVRANGKQSEQWRPKQHVVWEQATGHKVPPGFRVIFKDGNKENFDPANLELSTRAEIFAGVMARFLSNPPPLRKAVRANKQLQREIRRQIDDRPLSTPSGKPTGVGRRGIPIRRWTPQMVETLRRDYPTKPFPEVAAAIGVSVEQLRLKACKLGVHRSPEAMVAHVAAAAAIEKQQALRQENQS